MSQYKISKKRLAEIIKEEYEAVSKKLAIVMTIILSRTTLILTATVIKRSH